MKSTTHDWTELKSKAEALGFHSYTTDYLYGHPSFPTKIFDFSATDPNKLMLAVYNEGKRDGGEQMKKRLIDFVS